MKITFEISTQFAGQRLWPILYFDIIDEAGTIIMEPFATRGHSFDTYRFVAEGVLAEAALAIAKREGKGESILIERFLRRATVNSKTRVYGKEELRNDFIEAMEI